MVCDDGGASGEAATTDMRRRWEQVCVCTERKKKNMSISESHYVWFCDLKFNVAGHIARSAVLVGDPSAKRPTLSFLSFSL